MLADVTQRRHLPVQRTARAINLQSSRRSAAHPGSLPPRLRARAAAARPSPHAAMTCVPRLVVPSASCVILSLHSITRSSPAPGITSLSARACVLCACVRIYRCQSVRVPRLCGGQGVSMPAAGPATLSQPPCPRRERCARSHRISGSFQKMPVPWTRTRLVAALMGLGPPRSSTACAEGALRALLCSCACLYGCACVCASPFALCPGSGQSEAQT